MQFYGNNCGSLQVLMILITFKIRPDGDLGWSFFRFAHTTQLNQISDSELHHILLELSTEKERGPSVQVRPFFVLETFFISCT